MCPFCIATSVWIAAAAVSTSGIAALTAAKLFSIKTRKREEEPNHDNQ